LMDVPPSPAIPTSNAPMRSSTLATHDDDDDDDLGLGNSSRRRNVSLNDPGTSDTTAGDPKATQTDTRSRPGNTAMLSFIEDSLYSLSCQRAKT
jgi:hypothetical protein